MSSADLINDQENDALQDLLAKTKKKSDFQRIQSVFLRTRYKLKASEVAVMTGLQPGTVRQIWSLYKREGADALFCKPRGGRRNAHLSREQEKLFLRPFFKKAEHGGDMVVAEIKEAYETLVGRKVPKSTLYRMLSRHGWKRKPGRSARMESKGDPRPAMHEYWIGGCSQVLHPERTGNISQQWLNSTLSSMVRPD